MILNSWIQKKEVETDYKRLVEYITRKFIQKNYDLSEFEKEIKGVLITNKINVMSEL